MEKEHIMESVHQFFFLFRFKKHRIGKSAPNNPKKKKQSTKTINMKLIFVSIMRRKNNGTLQYFGPNKQLILILTMN